MKFDLRVYNLGCHWLEKSFKSLNFIKKAWKAWKRPFFEEKSLKSLNNYFQLSNNFLLPYVVLFSRGHIFADTPFDLISRGLIFADGLKMEYLAWIYFSRTKKFWLYKFSNFQNKKRSTRKLCSNDFGLFTKTSEEIQKQKTICYKAIKCVVLKSEDRKSVV